MEDAVQNMEDVNVMTVGLEKIVELKENNALITVQVMDNAIHQLDNVHVMLYMKDLIVQLKKHQVDQEEVLEKQEDQVMNQQNNQHLFVNQTKIVPIKVTVMKENVFAILELKVQNVKKDRMNVTVFKMKH
jgi:hypothetical protein